MTEKNKQSPTLFDKLTDPVSRLAYKPRKGRPKSADKRMLIPHGFLSTFVPLNPKIVEKAKQSANELSSKYSLPVDHMVLLQAFFVKLGDELMEQVAHDFDVKLAQATKLRSEIELLGVVKVELMAS
jgi:hypothetical protein